MKRQSRVPVSRLGRWLLSLVGLSIAVTPSAVSAADEDAAESADAEEPVVLSPEEFFEGGANTYDNWIELAVGGWFPSGNTSEFQQRQQVQNNVFGGIEDFHYQRDLGKDVLFHMDGRAIFDEEDYKLSLDFDKWDLGYVKFNFEQFRTWYNGDGGYYPLTDMWYPLGDDALGLDRGELTFEAGLRLENVPDVTFRYTHRYRDGQKGSTEWGRAYPDPSKGGLQRYLLPSVYDIDEKVDIFELDVEHQVKATGLGVGVRYETGDLDNTLESTANDVNGLTLQSSDREGTSYDLLNVHAFTETWIKQNLFLSSGFLFTDLDNNFSGARTPVAAPGYLGAGWGYANLNGGSRLQEYTLNLNLMATPWKNFSIVPSIRVQKEDWDADSSFMGMNAGTAPPSGTLFNASSDRDALDVRERLELRYSGVKNWVFYGRGEWTQGDGNLTEDGGIVVDGQPGVGRETDDSRFFQKYVAGINWYPWRRVSLNAQYYYKLHDYDYDHVTDNPALGGGFYPGDITKQGFETQDANIRLTLRPSMKLTLVSQYDFQLNTIDTEANSTAITGEIETGQTTRQIFSQNISWTPWSRLFLDLGFSYVLSDTTTPASDAASYLPDAQNDYLTLNLSGAFVLTDKTDLNFGYFLYYADNDDYAQWSDGTATPVASVPYGAGGTEQGVTCGVTHRLRENIRLNLRYGFAKYDDDTMGGNLDYDSHLVYGSVQYRF